MGPPTYGEYARLLSFIAIAFASIDLGVGEVFARFVPELQAAGGSQRLRVFASRFLALKLVTGTLACLLLFALLEWFYGERLPGASLLLVAGAVLAIDLGSVPYALAFGLNQLERCALRDPMKRALTLVLTLLGFHYFGLLGAVATTMIVEAGIAALYFGWTRSYFVTESLRPEIQFIRPYLAFGLGFYASFALSAACRGSATC
jgi:O-antigen/teichoic acid export membrane protein